MFKTKQYTFSTVSGVLKICACCIFLGRAYQYMFFDAPFRAFFWDEHLMTSIVEKVFNTPWRTYATNTKVDDYISIGIKVNGILFLISAISSALINKSNFKVLQYFVFLGSFSLLILAILSCKEHFFQFAQFFEYTIQIISPVLLVNFVKNKNIHTLTLGLKVIIALTFSAHGLYALSLFPTPGHFIDMTIANLGITENQSIVFLYIVGILDFIIAIGIFVPKISLYVLYYASFWGVVTALARITSNFSLDFVINSLHGFTYQVIYRLPHGLIPLCLIVIIYFNQFNYKNINYETKN